MPSEPTSYDQVPYRSLAYPQTHPDRLACMARLFGLTPPGIAHCRVLELGCASGGNLIPMAFHLPDSEFVGVDLSRHQVEEAQTVIRDLGMRNIRMAHASILDVDRSWGAFDYILCHGVFSWVEPPVQDQVFTIARDLLTPQGVAYVSYNTYPGWHMRENVRDMMRYHASGFDDPHEQIEQARALLTFLAAVAPESDPYGMLLRQEIERLRSTSDSYLYHEHLEQTNTPLYFHQFMARASRFGLRYLSEAAVSDMLSVLLPGPVAAKLEEITSDILHLEQYMDFVRNRQFRQTLLCHRAVRPTRALSPMVLHGLFVSSAMTAETTPVDLAAGQLATFRKNDQRAAVSLPASKAAFERLAAAWPQALDADDLCEAAVDQAAPHLAGTTADAARRGVMGDVFRAVMYGIVNVHTQPPSCANRLSDVPRSHPLSAYQAGRSRLVTNAYHESIELDPLTREVLRLANGQRRRDATLAALLERHATGRLVVEEDGQPVTSHERASAILGDRLELALSRALRSALLTA